MSFFVDANVLIYSAGTSEYRLPCLGILGAVAILLQKNPLLTPDQVKWLLVSTSRPVTGSNANGLDLARALAYNDLSADRQTVAVVQAMEAILARHVAGNAWYEAHNPNIIGGDINGGSFAGLQQVLRPRPGVPAYRTPNPRLYLCSSSTPPGGGVHGMCGMHAANAALRHSLA